MLTNLTVKTLMVVDELKRMSRDREGAALVEYGMAVGIIAVLAAVGVQAFGEALRDGFNILASKIPDWFSTI